MELVPTINFTDAIVLEYKDLLLQIRQILEKYKYNDEVVIVDNAIENLSNRNNMDFVKNVAGYNFWGGAMSVSDFCFYRHEGEEWILAKEDNRQMCFLMHRLGLLLMRDGVENPRIKALSSSFIQSANSTYS